MKDYYAKVRVRPNKTANVYISPALMESFQRQHTTPIDRVSITRNHNAIEIRPDSKGYKLCSDEYSDSPRLSIGEARTIDLGLYTGTFDAYMLNGAVRFSV